MALEAPAAIEMTDLQFRLRNNSQLFLGDSQQFDKCSLLATASLYGLVIAGTSKPELRVTQLSSIVGTSGNAIPARTIHLAQVPRALALSCDHSMLAVNYDLNGSTFVSVFSVPSFLSNNITLLYQSIVLSPELNVQVSELLWNPVIPNTQAVTLNNGSLSVLNFNGPGYELHSIDKKEEVRCASWSPKGKQIVVGFPNGKLAQYKPDLQLARTIPCPAGVYESPFDVITVQWLSTYQFAAVFLKRGQGECPAVFIVNAPKNVAPSYVNYDDICYSQSGPRSSQMFLNHILPWNIILVASANSMEIGILGTRETGETPVWSQYTLDELRPELPLTADKQESYPIGLAIDTGCSHQLIIDEVQLDVMPMLHLLSTHGQIISFDLVNRMAGIPTLCQAPKQVADVSGLAQFQAIVHSSATVQAAAPVSVASTVPSESFTVPPTVVTSTPAAQKPQPSMFGIDTKPPGTNLFGGNADATKTQTPFGSGLSSFGVPPTQPSAPAANPLANKISFGGFGSEQSAVPPPAFPSATTTAGSVFGAATPAIPPPAFGAAAGLFGGGGGAKPSFGAATTSMAFGPSGTVMPFGGQSQQPIAAGKPTGGFGGQPPAVVKPMASAAPNVVQSDANKPFYTVPGNYTAQKVERKNSTNSATHSNTSVANDDNNIIRKMIAEEIVAFELDWSAVLQRGRQLAIKIGTKEEMTASSKQLAELQDISNQATESTDALTMEIQTLRMSLNETFSMVTEAKAKRAMFENMDVNTLRDTSTMSQTNRRQLEKLRRLLATNEAQYNIVNKQIDAFWSSHQQNVKQNQRAMMHIPQMESIYMTLTKQRQILKSNAQKLGYIKSKLGYRDMGATHNGSITTTHDLTVNSLSDSIFSMSLCDQVKLETERLSDAKINALRDLLRTRQTIAVIQPKRPDRKGISSEVVMERRLAQERKKIVPVATANKVPDAVRTQQTKAPAALPTPQAPQNQTVKPNQQSGVVPSGFGFQNTDNKSFGMATSSLAPAAKPTPTTATQSVAQPKQPNIAVPSPKPQPPNTGFAFKAPPDTTGTASTPFGLTGTSMFGGSANKSFGAPPPITSASPAAGFQPPVPSNLSFGGSGPSAPIQFGSTSITASQNSPFTSTPSTAGAKPSAFSFNTSSINASFNTAQTKPLTPTLNALLPKGIAAAAAAEQKPATSTTNKATSANDKENQPKPTTTPSSSVAQPVASTTPSTIFANKPTNVFGNLPSTGSPFGTASSPFGSTPTKAATAAPNATSVFGNALSLATSSGSATPSSGTPSPKTVPSESVSPASSSSNSSSSAPSQGFTFSLPGSSGSTTVTPLPVSKPTATTAATVPPSSTTVTVTPAKTSAPTASTNDCTDNLLQNLTMCKPNTATTSTTAPNPPASSAGIFSMAAFGATTAAGAASPSTTSIFGGSASPAPSNSFGNATNVFGQPLTKSDPPAASVVPTTINTTTSSAAPAAGTPSPFAAFAAQNPGPPPAGSSIFGAAATNLVKPDQSVFGGGSASTNVFGSPPDGTAATTNVFGGGGGSMFGGGSTAAAPSAGSPFGGSATGSIFAQSSFGAPTGNVFGQSAASPVAGGSLFGGSSVFGGAASAPSTAATSTASIFGGGSALAPSAFGTSTFGSPAAPSVFGQTSSVFGGGANAASVQPVAAGGSLFSGGFGSPSAAAPSAFGGPPAFGAPSFGGAATFGSPKAAGFGTFGQAAASPPAFAAQVTQKNSLFESLGSSETGMTFGNIAQNTNQPAPSSSFGGGSSFSSWR